MKSFLKFKTISVFLSLFIILINGCKQADQPGITTFDLKSISRNNPAITTLADGKEFNSEVLNIKPVKDNTVITIWNEGDKGDWKTAKYFTFEILDKADYSGVINLEFYRRSETANTQKVITQTPWLTCLLGVLPKVKTKVVFSLSYLDAQEIFIPRFPRQLKGTISGNRLDPADIVRVDLRFGPYAEPWFQPEFEVAAFILSDSLPVPYPTLQSGIIDVFGQRKDKEWPGKIADESALINQNTELEKLLRNNSFIPEWSKYGGWKQKRFRATGFFRTQHDGTRWWLVDPEGYAFLSAGVDCIRLTSSGPVTGIEDLFDWLPAENDSLFNGSLTTGRGAKNMDFYKSNLMRVFGKDWQTRWSSVTAGLMRNLNINTVGNWSDVNFARENRIAYVLPLNRFPSTKVLLYRDFPDVFSEEYLKNSVDFASQLNDYKNDPYLVGYFLRNEPQWAFGYHNLAYEMFGTAQESATKSAFIAWLSERYQKDMNSFNTAWNLDIKDFASLSSLTFKNMPSEKADSDFYAFTEIMVKKYVDIPCDEVMKVDKNHLNLGMRYAWMSSDLLYKAGERFDVFSINGYGYEPPATAEIAKRSGKPVMIGEFHHGAVDRALPATGITGVLTQEQRATAYRNYIEQGFARPELVGMHYFQWVDQPYYGRFDGENYNIGLVTITNTPYPELTEAIRISNERIYKVGAGLEPPFKGDITKVPSIHY